MKKNIRPAKDIAAMATPMPIPALAPVVSLLPDTVAACTELLAVAVLTGVGEPVLEVELIVLKLIAGVDELVASELVPGAEDVVVSKLVARAEELVKDKIAVVDDSLDPDDKAPKMSSVGIAHEVRGAISGYCNIPAQYDVPYEMVFWASFSSQASLAQSRTPYPKFPLVQ